LLYVVHHGLFVGVLTLEKYHTVQGTDIVVPIMSLDDDFEKMSLGATGDPTDPVAAASKLGRKPTLKEVKRSVKVCHSIII
jgi:hypothetical protein